MWRKYNSKLRIERIFLSDPEFKAEDKALDSFKKLILKSSKSINSFGEKIQKFMRGASIQFNLEQIDFSQCFDIQKKVLLAEFKIPRGWVSTYKRIAVHIGLPKGARVVGNALARNPFPIVIPCHRAIKSNGELGGFQGGITMKRRLLELEGIKFSRKGKVISSNFYY